jgi:hypothetical protein
MPYSYTQYTGDGVTSTYSIPFPYIHNSHIKIKVDNEPETAWGWVGDATVRFERPPTRGASILIYRQTPLNNRFVDFQNGAGLDEHDLDLDSDQLFYIQQEMSDWGLTGEFAPPPEEVEPEPNTPTGLKVVGGFRSLHVSWVNPLGGTMPFTEILLGENSDRTTAKTVARVMATTHSIFDLDVLRTYWVWVRAINLTTGLYSPWVGPVSATTKAIEQEDFLEPIIDDSDIVQELIQYIDIDNILNQINVDRLLRDAVERVGETVLGAIVQSDEDFHINKETLEAEAHQRLILAAKVNDNTAALQEERSARANLEEAEALYRQYLQAQVDNNSSAILTEKSARAAADRAEASKREILAARVDGAEAAIAETAEVIANLDGTVKSQWMLKVQAFGEKNAVAGIGLLADGATGESEFTVLADKFFVYHPEEGIPKKVFQIIDGQAYLIGDLIAEGTIQGNRINAKSVIQLANGGQLLIGTGGLIQLGNNIYMDGNRATFSLANFQLADTDVNGVVTIPFEKRADGKIYMKDVIADKATISDATIQAATIAELSVTNAKIANATIQRLKIKDYELSEYKSSTATNTLNPTNYGGGSETVVPNINSLTINTVASYPIHVFWAGFLYNHEVDIDIRIRNANSSISTGWMFVSERGWNDFGATNTLITQITPSTSGNLTLYVDARFYDKDDSWGASRIGRRTLMAQSVFK